MRWNATVAVLLIVLVASLALNAYQYSSPRSKTTTATAILTTTSVTTTSTTVISYVSVSEGLLYTSSVSPEGLQLRVMLNSSSIQPHGEVAVRIDLVKL